MKIYSSSEWKEGHNNKFPTSRSRAWLNEDKCKEALQLFRTCVYKSLIQYFKNDFSLSLMTDNVRKNFVNLVCQHLKEKCD
jgi:hypothetical protein